MRPTRHQSINEVNPVFDNLCYASTLTGRRCRNPVNKHARSIAGRYLATARHHVSDKTRYQALCKASHFLCCKRNHRNNTRTDREFQDLVEQWYKELDGDSTMNEPAKGPPTKKPCSPVLETVRRSKHTPISELLMKPLGPMSSKTGSLYIYQKNVGPGLVKIGWTTQKMNVRMGQIKTKCGYTPIVVAEFKSVPFVQRVEQLVFKELAPFRCWDVRDDCGVRHIEWFRVEASHAKQVIKNWILLMEQERLYLPCGQPSFALQGVIDGMNARRMVVNAKSIRAYWARYSWC